jgi:hypothetical protein
VRSRAYADAELAGSSIGAEMWQAEVTCPLRNGTCVTVKDGYAAPVHAVIGNGGQSLTPCLAQPPAWSLWCFPQFGYSAIEVTGAERLVMRFYADQLPAPNELVHTLELKGYRQ